jgi:hypothetical protein
VNWSPCQHYDPERKCLTIHAAAAKAFKLGFHANISHFAFENDLKVSDMWHQVCGK